MIISQQNLNLNIKLYEPSPALSAGFVFEPCRNTRPAANSN